MFDLNGQNSQFPGRLLRLLSMGCGISKFNPKEADEAHNNPQNCTKYACFLPNESKSFISNGAVLVPPPIDSEREEVNPKEEEENEGNSNKVCRGGSPSFREYCTFDVHSGPRCVRITDDDCNGAKACKWQNEESSNLEKGTETQMSKKERKGRSFMNALHLGKPGVRNFLHASRRSDPNETSPTRKIVA